MKESNIQNNIRLKLSSMGIVNFRNNTAMAWAGKAVRAFKPMIINLMPGDVVIRKAYPLHAGLHKGSGDVIAIKKVVITKDMVGQTIGQFLSVEVKTKTGRVSLDQKQWDQMIKDNGGLSIIARGDNDLDIKSLVAVKSSIK